MTADDCCAASEQSQHATATVLPMSLGAPPIVLCLPVATFLTVSATDAAPIYSFVRSIQKRPQSLKYLRNSVLLI